MQRIDEQPFKPVLVVGAGPSGIACALRLQQAGQDVCVVDKACFPREKLCGGLLTHKTRVLLRTLLGARYDEALREAGATRHDTITLWNGMRRMVAVNLPSELDRMASQTCLDMRELPVDDPCICVVQRPRLDNCLVEHFKQQGGEMLEGDGVVDVDFDNRVVTLASGRRLAYRRLVVCDGANSHVAHLLQRQKSCRLDNGRKTLCCEINVDPADVDVRGIHVHVGAVAKSYAYVFSKQDAVCIGLCKVFEADFNAKASLLRFCKDIGVRNLDRYPVKGAMIPRKTSVKDPVWQDSVFLAGDAAGLIDYPTAEGLYFAYQTGVDVAEALLAGDAALYRQRYRSLYRYVRGSEFYQRLTTHPRFLSVMQGKAERHSGFVAYFYLMRIESLCRHSFLRLMWNWKRRKRKSG